VTTPKFEPNSPQHLILLNPNPNPNPKSKIQSVCYIKISGPTATKGPFLKLDHEWQLLRSWNTLPQPTQTSPSGRRFWVTLGSLGGLRSPQSTLGSRTPVLHGRRLRATWVETDCWEWRFFWLLGKVVSLTGCGRLTHFQNPSRASSDGIQDRLI
jgi:hypothetical protein